MKAILSRDPGGPDSLVLEDVDEPTIGHGDVLLAVEAVSLNFADTLIIADRYQVKPPRPFSPGGECAGTILAVGPGVDSLCPGDRVAAYVGHGALCERIAVPAAQVVPIPDGLSTEAASTLLVTWGTALYGLSQRGGLKAGETLAVLGAAGGTGSAAVVLGKLLGARVIGCATGADRCAFVRGLGADLTIDTAEQDLKAELKALTSGTGADVVFDTVGGEATEAAVRATAWGGRFLVVGFAGGIPRLPLNLVMLKGIDVVGVHWSPWIARDPAAHRAAMAFVFARAEEGAIRPHIDARYPLEHAPEALQALADRKVLGKIVVTPGGGA